MRPGEGAEAPVGTVGLPRPGRMRCSCSPLGHGTGTVEARPLWANAFKLIHLPQLVCVSSVNVCVLCALQLPGSGNGEPTCGITDLTGD